MVRGSIPVWRVAVEREQAEFIDLHFQDHVPSWKSPDIWVDWAAPVQGVITAPERPGHGLRVKPEIVADCVVG